MKILVVGGTGHIGSYLVPRLTSKGHEVTVVARRSEPQYVRPDLGWKSVRWITADRSADEKTGTWAKRMAAIQTDVVMDLICYTPEQNQVMYEVFRGRIRHFLHCGTIWSYGPPEQVPYEESFVRKPITDYGRMKAEIEEFLLGKHRAEGFPATIIHPGHICGRRWLPIDPQGSRDGAGVYRKLARGEPVYLPDRGTATIHHVHADDVAQLFELSMEQPNAALGESFSAVAPYAMSLAGCCNVVAALFGAKPNLRFVPLADMVRHVGEASAGIISEHVTHSPCASIAKGRKLLGYSPRYTTEQIYMECIEHLLDSGQLKLT
jgi:nucleoside-diphosphate-sugar epimerase